MHFPFKSNEVDHAANKEKSSVALASLIAACVLTISKLIIGFWTNSLGILSEATHSGLDLIAAAVTLFAVKSACKPADQTHTYGHWKIENLSALFETALLLVTCIWILYEAVDRLLFKEAIHVDANIFAFITIFASIVIDYSRSRALNKTAKKYNSQALAADALHFSTDMWASCVVFLGLICVVISHKYTQIVWLQKADTIAALGVAGISIWVSIKLGKKSLNDLLDTIPSDLQEKVFDAIHSVHDVWEVRKVRVRRSGPKYFADVTFVMEQEAVVERAHHVSKKVEEAVREILPDADVVSHVEPAESGNESIVSKVKMIAIRLGLGVHNIRIYDHEEGRALELHLEVDEKLSVDQAHQLATKFENEIRREISSIHRIYTHLEPMGDTLAICHAEQVTAEQVNQALRYFLKSHPVSFYPHDISVRIVDGELSASFHCSIDATLNITDAHMLTKQIEKYIKSKIPNLSRVIIHLEPEK